MKANKSLPSNEEWQAWAKLDPLYAVATIHERAKSGGNPWTEASFYQIGAIDWDLFRASWEQYGLSRGTCVEIGCGAGRLTAQLARYFHSVHGLDVSAGMIEYARAHVPSNVSFHVTGGLDIPLPDNSADAIFSAHVLQHMSRENRIGRVVRQGDVQAAGYVEGNIGGHVGSGIFDHARGDIQSVHAVEIARELRCQPARATSDFHASAAAQSILFPTGAEEIPVDGTNLVKTGLGPGISTTFCTLMDGGNSIKRV